MTVDLTDGDLRRRLAQDAIFEFCEVAQDWSLEEAGMLSLLCDPPAAAFRSWVEAACSDLAFDMPPHIFERIAVLVRISRILSGVFADPGMVLHWLNAPVRGPLFHGVSPVDAMSLATNDELDTIRQGLLQSFEHPERVGVIVRLGSAR